MVTMVADGRRHVDARSAASGVRLYGLGQASSSMRNDGRWLPRRSRNDGRWLPRVSLHNSEGRIAQHVDFSVGASSRRLCSVRVIHGRDERPGVDVRVVRFNAGHVAETVVASDGVDAAVRSGRGRQGETHAVHGRDRRPRVAGRVVDLGAVQVGVP